MALSNNEIKVLAAKMIHGTITPTEQERLNSWLNEQMSKESFEVDQSFASSSEDIRKRMLAEIIQRTHSDPQLNTKYRKIFKWPFAAAASILIIGAISFYLSYKDVYKPGQKHVGQTVNIVADTVQPGSNKATLTLADGRVINLSDAQSGIRVDDGKVTYLDGTASVIEINQNNNSELSEMLTVTTPMGGTYQVVLPDGSEVWLNANSTLTYPSKFTKNERKVNFSGEAYFSVVRNTQKPFKVISHGQQIEVLGTEFNINSYPNEAESKTTLVKGSVRVRVLNSLEERYALLKPGEQSTVQGGIIGTKYVDTEQYTAWKEGYFYFDGLSPQIAFSQLGRWYDIDVKYQGKIPTVSFFGMIERSKPLGSILKILEKSGVKFKVSQVNDRKELLVITD